MDRFKGVEIASDFFECFNCDSRFVYDDGVEFEGNNFCGVECSGGVKCSECDELKDESEIIDVNGVDYCKDCGYKSCLKCGVGFNENDGSEINDNYCSENCYNVSLNEKLKCSHCTLTMLKGYSYKKEGEYCSSLCLELSKLNSLGYEKYVTENDKKFAKTIGKERLQKLNNRYKQINFNKYSIKQNGTVCIFEDKGYKYIIGLSCLVIVNDRVGSNNEKLIYNFNIGDNLKNVIEFKNRIEFNNTDDFYPKIVSVLNLFVNLFDFRRSIEQYK